MDSQASQDLNTTRPESLWETASEPMNTPASDIDTTDNEVTYPDYRNPEIVAD